MICIYISDIIIFIKHSFAFQKRHKHVYILLITCIVNFLNIILFISKSFNWLINGKVTFTLILLLKQRYYKKLSTKRKFECKKR